MKLTNDQINSLANVILKKQRDNNEVIRNKFRKSIEKECRAEAKRLFKITSSLPEFLIRYYDEDYIYYSLMSQRENAELKLQAPEYSKIRDDIVIATIDSSSLEELKNKFGI